VATPDMESACIIYVLLHHFIGNEDIHKRDFGQVNKILCFLSNLKSCVIHKLFQSYWMSMYACELWLLGCVSCNARHEMF